MGSNFIAGLSPILRVSSGPWSRAEEEELTEIVTEMTVKQGKNMDNDVFWSVVSERMGNRRGRQQCRIKWYAARIGYVAQLKYTINS